MALLNFEPPIIAHRGASADAPENTLVAFNKAAQAGIKWVEFDVMQSADGEAIIFHDDLLDRTTNGKGEVSQHSYAYLRSLDAGAWFNPVFSGEKIPSLQEVIEFLNRTHLSANVEIKAKPGEDEQVVVRTLEEISRYWNSSRSTILFSSFSLPALQALRRHAPQCLLGLLIHDWYENWEADCIALQCVSVHVNNDILTRDSAQQIKAMGKKLLCYTVNEPQRAKELYAFGVDAVFSDVPQKILRSMA